MSIALPSTDQLRTELGTDDLTTPVPGRSAMEQFGAPCNIGPQVVATLTSDDLSPQDPV